MNKLDPRLKYRWDNKNVLDYAKELAGEKKAKEIAHSLRKSGESVQFILDVTGIDLENSNEITTS
ncbi:hypothetical protein [Pedobacter metabolipauper]|uniref:Uncharacterized protein n=1 Tax=Pedobacter metabolipauper TaxID=425513 RepID=A0A4R6T258_9SPHI|nr:hypothetical protein [Pedobacter metabolipauper]TDQ11411.1 hypothetical protein ATK78_0533 [Pedobacter metabolipauper]